MNNVLILMSTYYGEKYIEEQIDSLLEQKNVKVQILVRDDGSNDNTCRILEKYSKKDARIEYYQGQNMGAAQSFLELIKIAPKAEYYAFCDQDDVWDDDKLSVAVKALEKINGPAIYSCKKRIVDSNLVELYVSGYFDPETKLCSLARESAITGCTMVFNRSLMNILKHYIPKKVTMHDAWTRDVCLCVTGKIIFDETPHISYRQHESNVVGGKKDLVSKIRRFRKRSKNLTGIYEIQWKELKRGYYDIMLQNEREVLDLCISYRNTLINKMKIIFDKRISGFKDPRRFFLFCYKVFMNKF